MTGMALIRRILGEFLGVVCYYFAPRLDVPTFAARCLQVLKDARDPRSEMWNYGREMSGNFAYMTSQFTPLGIFTWPQIYDMGPTAFYFLLFLCPLITSTFHCWRAMDHWIIRKWLGQFIFNRQIQNLFFTDLNHTFNQMSCLYHAKNNEVNVFC